MTKKRVFKFDYLKEGRGNTYIKYGYFGQILQSFPFSSEVLHTAHNDHVFELMIMEVGCSERHHQVPQTYQRGVRVSKQTDNNMAIEDSHGGLVTVLKYKFKLHCESLVHLVF